MSLSTLLIIPTPSLTLTMTVLISSTFSLSPVSNVQGHILTLVLYFGLLKPHYLKNEPLTNPVLRMPFSISILYTLVMLVQLFCIVFYFTLSKYLFVCNRFALLNYVYSISN